MANDIDNKDTNNPSSEGSGDDFLRGALGEGIKQDKPAEPITPNPEIHEIGDDGKVKLDANNQPILKTAATPVADDVNKNTPPANIIKVEDVIEGSVIEIEGEDYTIDKEGNALDKEGKIFLKPDELKAAIEKAAEQNDVPVIEEIIRESGFKLVDEQGQPKKYEDTPKGMVQLAKDLGKQFQIQNETALLESDPDLKDYFIFKKLGGTDPKEFYKQKLSSWADRSFDAKNEDAMVNIIIEDLVAKGASKEDAAEIAKLAKDKGIDELAKRAKPAFDSRVNSEKAAREADMERIRQAQIQEQNNEITYWNETNKIISTGELENIQIPEADKKAFFDYLSKPIDDQRNSQYLLDQEKLNPKLALELRYLMFKKFDLKALVQREAKTSTTKTLRDKINSGKAGFKLKGGQGEIPKIVNASDAKVGLHLIK